MGREEIEMYLQTLAGYVEDDDKLVTYKWLSKELEIHVNIAKQILWEFWEQHRKQVSASFMLMGSLSDGGLRVEVVKEPDLTAAKQKFSNLISEHLYSLQKALPDMEQLAEAGEGDSRYSGVSCEESTERSNEELEVLRWGSKLPDKTTISSLAKNGVAANVNGKKSNTQMSAGSMSKPAVVEKKAAASKAGAFNSFFGKPANQQTKTKSPPATNQAKDKSPTESSTKAKDKTSKDALAKTGKAKSSMDSFFHKVKDKSPTDTSNDKAKNKSPKDEDKSPADSINNKGKDKSPNESSNKKGKDKSPKDTSNSKGKDEAPKNITSEDPVPSKKVKKESPKIADEKSPETTKRPKSKAAARGKKRQSSAGLESTTKRRKRIVVLSESSEESSGKEDEEPEGPPSPPPVVTKEAPPSPPRFKRENGKRKVRKLVDKVFQDDDGYVVTQKEFVYESCSSEEEEVTKVEPPKPKPKAQPQPKANTKQATLFSFFKKS